MKQTKRKSLSFSLALVMLLTFFTCAPQLVMADPATGDECDIVSISSPDLPGVTLNINQGAKQIYFTVPNSVTSLKLDVTLKSAAATWALYAWPVTYDYDLYRCSTKIMGLYEGVNAYYIGVENGNSFKTYSVIVVKEKKTSYSTTPKDVFAGGPGAFNMSGANVNKTEVAILMDDGSVWGFASSRLLGADGDISYNKPVRTAITNIVDIAIDYLHSDALYLDNKGRVIRPGWHDGPPEVIIDNIQNVYSGFGRHFFLDNDGYLWGAGSNSYGDLDPDNSSSAVGVNRRFPQKISWLPKIKPGRDSVAVGSLHTMALGQDGKVYCWGNNKSGQLGDGTTSGGFTSGLKSTILSNIAAVGATGETSYAIGSDGKVWGWGAGGDPLMGYGQPAGVPAVFSDSQTTPLHTNIPDMTAIIRSGSDYGARVGLGKDGNIWTWDRYALGQFNPDGITQLSDPYYPKNTLTNVKSFDTAPYGAVALKNDGTIWFCGWGSYIDPPLSGARQGFVQVPVNFSQAPEIHISGNENSYYIMEVKPQGAISYNFNTVLKVGSTIQMAAFIRPTNATNKNVTWESQYPHLLTIDQNGLATAIASSENSASTYGSITITATTADGGYSSDEIIRTTGGIPVERLDLLPGGTPYNYTSQYTVASGATIPSPVSIYPANASNKKISYYISEPDVATIDENGNITGVSNGVTYVSATSDDETNKDLPNGDRNYDLEAVFYINVSGTAPAYKPGDVNNDGKINMQDVLLIYQNFRGKITFSSPQTTAADVNKDGKVNMTDVLQVYQYFRGKTSGL